jgi:chromosome segregation ATPase
MPLPEPPAAPNFWSIIFGILGAAVTGLVTGAFSLYRSLRSTRGKGGPLRETDAAAAETERTEITAKLKLQEAEIQAEQRDRDRDSAYMAELARRIDANHAESLALVKAHSDREAEWNRERAAMESEWVRQIDTLSEKYERLEAKLAAVSEAQRQCEERGRVLAAENERLRREGDARRTLPQAQKKVDSR